MHDLEVLREVHRRQARRALGVSAWGPRLLGIQARNALREGDILSLPVEPTTPAQTSDGTAFLFMHGYSAWGSDDPHAG